MRMKYLLAAALVAAMGAANASAQTESTTTGEGPYLEEDQKPLTQEEIKQQAAGNVGKDGQAQWFINMDYAGFDFELPAGTVVQKGSSLLATYPDSSFGVSMKNEEMKGSNQKLAYEVCKRLALQMHLPNPKVEKASFGKCGGAKATGMLDGQLVTVVVLPYSDQQTTAVILANPEREEWANHFLRTLKR